MRAVDFNLDGELALNYRYTPERKNEIFHSESLILEGNSERVMGRIGAEFASQEFGESAYMDISDEYPYTAFYKSTVAVTIPTAQLKVERLNTLFNEITIGNIWVGYSPYIVAPFWGWKGISVKGRKGSYEHDTFMIKRQYNSYSLGNRSLYYFNDHRLRVIGLYDYKAAKLMESDLDISGSSSDAGEWAINQLSTQYSYLATGLFRFMESRVNCELNYGQCVFNEDAEADYSNPKWPVYSHAVSSGAVKDDMYELKLFLDGIAPGTKLAVSYRDIGEDFTPEYRQEPILFEETTGDKEGYLVRLKQYYTSYNVNLYWDTYDRKSNDDYYGNIINYGLGYIGPRGMEAGINKEVKREKDTGKDEIINSLIMTFRYSVIYPLTPGVRYPLSPKITFREDRIHHKETDSKYTTHSLQLDIDFKVRTDFGFSVCYKTTRYGDSSWISNEAPYDDDYLNVYCNARF
ncbi:hypothetical protein ACFLUV_02200 [Elusimicrobiota bacterium]